MAASTEGVEDPMEPAQPTGPQGINTKPLFRLMVERRASDLFFSPNSPIKIKIEGQIFPVNKQILSVEMVRQAAFGLMNPEQVEKFGRDQEIDFAISESGLGRFRVNVFRQRGNPAMVLRHVAGRIPKLSDLSLPDSVQDLMALKRGMVLVVGSTGSGKSTTLAAMINHRNENFSEHILTIEDPIEFLHANKRSIVNQREIGIDTRSYENALRSAVRAAPDVIMIGEIRDRETMQSALNLSGIGHLVLATLHANNAPETMDRIINMFPRDQHQQLLLDLSQYLRAIIAQRLIPGRDGRRVVAAEVMLNTSHIADLVRKGDIVALKEAISASNERGVQSFDAALFRMIKEGRIAPDEALAHADSRSNLEARLNFG
jgi:twitching motility protein PilU